MTQPHEDVLWWFWGLLWILQNISLSYGSQANFELAKLRNATFDNAVATEMYMNSTTGVEAAALT